MLNFNKHEKILLIILILAAFLGVGIRIYKISSRDASLTTGTFNAQRDFDIENFIKEHRFININKASFDDLVKIPGVGPALAGRILQYRQDKGPFNSIDDIKNVKGIGDKKFEEMKDYIAVE